MYFSYESYPWLIYTNHSFHLQFIFMNYRAKSIILLSAHVQVVRKSLLVEATNNCCIITVWNEITYFSKRATRYQVRKGYIILNKKQNKKCSWFECSYKIEQCFSWHVRFHIHLYHKTPLIKCYYGTTLWFILYKSVLKKIIPVCKTLFDVFQTIPLRR